MKSCLINQIYELTNKEKRTLLKSFLSKILSFAKRKTIKEDFNLCIKFTRNI